MSLEHGLLLLVGESHQKRNLGEAQPPGKELDGDGATLHYHFGFTEVYLGVHTGRVRQRYEDRTLPGTLLVHILHDSRLSGAS
ncbi:hypothetical protein ACFLX1_00600 [Chloroflexota bacterium]